ncbi:hypothetical protein Glove_606g107 [Diversispora epigaea]|uniref:Uncharacterized protein n=1 Tax=Diversispora epigaea TaxID=1348612 RepID=A0A397G9V7_9GLOM|nr:hypothetical protein Glove_606g107 [Diversispora epigaea]
MINSVTAKVNETERILETYHNNFSRIATESINQRWILSSSQNDWLKRNPETIANNTENYFNNIQVERAQIMLLTLKVDGVLRMFEGTNNSQQHIINIQHQENWNKCVMSNDGYKTPPPRTSEVTITSPKKPILCYNPLAWSNNYTIFGQTFFTKCVIMKIDHVDNFPKEVRGWLIDVLSVVDRIVPLFKAIQSVYREYIFDWIEQKRNHIHRGIWGPENSSLKNIREDTEKLIKEGMFGLVSLLRDYLDKNARNICTYVVQCIGDRITLSELRLDKKHFYKISQIKSAMIPFSFEVEKFKEVFELLYALVNGLKNQTSELKKLMLADSVGNVPTIRDWIWIPNTLSTWEMKPIL